MKKISKIFLICVFLVLGHIDCNGTEAIINENGDGGNRYGDNYNESGCDDGEIEYSDGSKYIGEVKNGMRHGQGTYIDIDGSKYVGEWKNDSMRGQGTFTWLDGRKYLGDFKDGFAHGQGTYTWPDGSKYIGEFKDDMMHGQGIYTWPDGSEYVGEFKDDMRYAGTYTRHHGSKYAGEIRNDMWHGQGLAIKIIKKANGARPYIGFLNEPIVFKIKVFNHSNAEINGVVVKNKIKEGVEYISSSPEPGIIQDINQGYELIWNLGKFSKGAEKEFTVILKSKNEGNLHNRVTVLSKNKRPQTASSTIDVIGAPTVYIIKEGPEEIAPGEVINYVLTIQNAGNSIAKDVVIRDVIPTGLQYQSRDPNISKTLRWRLGNMHPKERRTIRYKLKTLKEGKYTSATYLYVRYKGKNDRPIHQASFTTNVIKNIHTK